MATSQNLKKELKGLGADIAKAFHEAKESPEFKKLQSNLIGSIKSISKSLAAAAKTANKSQSAGKIKRRIGRLAVIGKKEGAVQLKKAEAKATAQLRKARAALKKLRKR